MNKKQLAIFDMDGTLFDTDRLNYTSYSLALAKYGFTLKWEEYRDKCSGRHYTAFLPYIVKDPALTEQIHEDKKLIYMENLHLARENTHLFNLIELMRGTYHIALATTANKKNAMSILESFKRRELFEYMVTGEDLTRVKPLPDAFLMAMEHFGVSPEDTVIFEDSDTGIEAAMARGANVIKILRF